jgi:hypothetical protein
VRRLVLLLVAVVACNTVLLASAAAKPPTAGLLVPGKSLGGLRLGMTKAQVKAAWGTDFGLCRNCGFLTWYYNYTPFTPQGAGVEFRSARVAAIFTLRAPPGWHTTKRLRIGDPVSRVSELYGTLSDIGCPGSYDAMRLLTPTVVTTFYVQDEKVYGFGLSRVEVPACR